MKKMVTALGVAACITATMTACQPGDDVGEGPGGPSSTQTSRTSDGSPVATTVPGATTSPGGSTGDAPATAGHGKCLDTANSVVSRAVGNINSYYGRNFDAYRATTATLPDCPNLTWVEAHLKGGTGSSPKRVLFFDANGYLGTDTERNSAFMRVVGSTLNTVSVEYRWLNDGDATAGPTGGPVVVNYTLQGSKVVADRAVPPEVFGDHSQPSTTPPSTTVVSHCDSATASTLHDAADLQYHDQLVQPFTMVNIICDGQWAIARTQSSAAQPVRALFQYTGGGWSAIAMGSGLRCTEKGVPAATASKLGCG